jgi:hypothetical protein
MIKKFKSWVMRYNINYKKYTKNPKKLKIFTEIDDKEYQSCLNAAITNAEHENKFNPYIFKTYLHYFMSEPFSVTDVTNYLNRIRDIKQEVYYKIQSNATDYDEIVNILEKDDYIAINTSRRNVILKVYKVKRPVPCNKTRDFIIKTYLYDARSPLQTILLLDNGVIHEITFHKYAHEMNKECGFISPVVYSYGCIKNLKNIKAYYWNPNASVQCYFIIMEYLHGIRYKNMYNDLTIEKNAEIISHRLIKRLHYNNEMKSSNNFHIDYSIGIIDFGESNNTPR